MNEPKKKIILGVKDVLVKGIKGDPGERGKDGLHGKDGLQGLSGRDGQDGLDGQNADATAVTQEVIQALTPMIPKEDTGDGIIEKINNSDEQIDRDRVQGLDDLEKRIAEKNQSYGGGGMSRGQVEKYYVPYTGSTRAYVSRVVALTDTATPALDASLANTFTLLATGNRTIAVPTNPTNGQKITIRHTASGGARTLALNTGAGGFRFGDNPTVLTQTVSGKTDWIGCIYHGTDGYWDIVAYETGY